MINKQKITELALRFYTSLIEKLEKHKFKGIIFLSGVAWSLYLVGIYGVFFSAPVNFPIEKNIRINKNITISQVSDILYEQNLVQSGFVFKVLASFSDSGKIVAGDYNFKESSNVFTLVRRFTRGEFGIEPIKVTILEGLNSKEIATLLEKKLPAFNKEIFLRLASLEEGRLFPDTYFIKPADDEKDIVKMLVNNFEKQVAEIRLETATSSDKSFAEILTMASIIEAETRTSESRRMISGILWNRIDQDMKLQVDVVFPYIMDKYSLQLTTNDLQVDSPYNTYKYKGLPPGPIGNPGLDSIKAAIEPTKTSYLFYLSDRDGNMHYAKTYKSHMVNRQKYIGG